MFIELLPAQLANQIAAGEVVERPSSVVKELIENSLDADATSIEIELDKGGTKRILIRDNGFGINKEELTLALSRHATSKIKTLDDLESILSLGFRGEALASISSVSRLTLTSKTEEQNEGWSAYAEGREMAVKIKPAAHPTGTTIEVLDLFFNTPARKKFLRTEKTEFNHIESLLKRIALSRFDCSFSLKHNGQLIKHYKIAQTEAQINKRVSSILGSYFQKNSLYLEQSHHLLQLKGWIITPQAMNTGHRLTDQFCYVNGRMMKDKLIYHAINQAYSPYLNGLPIQPSYALFITINPKDVDVNVHPSKHEVRFHEARIVHDFICQTITEVLSQEQGRKQSINLTDIALKEDNLENSELMTPLIKSESNDPMKIEEPSSYSIFRNSSEALSPKTKAQKKNYSSDYALEKPSMKELSNARALLQPFAQSSEKMHFPSTADTTPLYYGKGLMVIEQHYLLLQKEEQLMIADLSKIEYQLERLNFLAVEKEPLKHQPLLIPQRLPLSEEEWLTAKNYQPLLSHLGVHLHLTHSNKSKQGTLLKITSPFRHYNLQQLIPDLLFFFKEELPKPSLNEKEEPFMRFQSHHWNRLIEWLSDQMILSNCFNLAQAIQIFDKTEQLSLLLTENELKIVDTTSLVRFFTT